MNNCNLIRFTLLDLLPLLSASKDTSSLIRAACPAPLRAAAAGNEQRPLHSTNASPGPALLRPAPLPFHLCPPQPRPPCRCCPLATAPGFCLPATCPAPRCLSAVGRLRGSCPHTFNSSSLSHSPCCPQCSKANQKSNKA